MKRSISRAPSGLCLRQPGSNDCYAVKPRDFQHYAYELTNRAFRQSILVQNDILSIASNDYCTILIPKTPSICPETYSILSDVTDQVRPMPFELSCQQSYQMSWLHYYHLRLHWAKKLWNEIELGLYLPLNLFFEVPLPEAGYDF
jgi:hypothetical protein